MELDKDPVSQETIDLVGTRGVDNYKYGFSIDIASKMAPIGHSEEIVGYISERNEEPAWLLDWRIKSYRGWLTMKEPTWAQLNYKPVNLDETYFYAAPDVKEKPETLDDVDPELLRAYEKLGVPLYEQEILAGVKQRRVAVDVVLDSVSVITTFKAELAKAGVIFCPISEAAREHSQLLKRYLGSVVPQSDNYYAALNSAVYSDGSFVFVPKGVRCPMELSTYFRMNERNTGQFERTLIICEDDAYVSYLEGCTAPSRDEHQLHAAVVELVAHDNAEIKYSTVQNWYPGDANGVGGVYNFVTKRGECRGFRSKISWTQVETGSAITWKYPSCILRGDESSGEFYSVAISTGRQQIDSGTKMVHLGKNTKSRIVSKGVSADQSSNCYRGLVTAHAKAKNAKNFTVCDSLLLGDKCSAHTVPYIEAKNDSCSFEHEASTSKVAEDQLFYCRSRGMNEEAAVALIVNGFLREVLQELPMEFAVEAQKLIELNLEGSVG